MPNRPYEDMFIGMVHVFSTDTFERRRVKMAGQMQTQLTYSYNGFNWYRGPRDAFIPTRDYGLQGGGQVYSMEMLRTREDRLLFYAHGSFGEHAAYPDMQQAGLDTHAFFNVLLYEMRLDGFCSMKTWGKDGLLRTKTIIPKSGKLQLNVRTTNHTAVRVQLLDGNSGEPIPGYTLAEAQPIRGDHLFAEPRWQERSDLAELVGKPVRIEVHMREAEIFAIRIDCQVYVGTEPTEHV